MTQLLLAGGFALLLWWVGTASVLYLDGRPRHTWPTSMAAATVLAVLALGGLAASAGHATPAAAYLAFACAIAVWGWLEMAFLMGYVTGPDQARCPPDATGWRRFRLAARALIHHELALVGALAAIAALTWHGEQRFGLWAFAALWAMRLSTKLNIFLGVRNLYENWLPDELRHLESFFRRRPVNVLFPVSVTLSTLAAVLLVQAALAPGASPVEAAGWSLLAALVLLGLLEHWLLILPLPVDALWQWSLRSRADATEAQGTSTTATPTPPDRERSAAATSG